MGVLHFLYLPFCWAYRTGASSCSALSQPKGSGPLAYLQRMCVLPPESGGVRGWSEVGVSGDESAFFAESFGFEADGGVLSFIRTILAKRVLH